MQIENVSPVGVLLECWQWWPSGNQHCQPFSRAWHGPPEAMDCEWPVPPVPLSRSVWLCKGREEKAKGREGSPRSGLCLGKVEELWDREVGTEGHTEDFKLGQEGEGRRAGATGLGEELDVSKWQRTAGGQS